MLNALETKKYKYTALIQTPVFQFLSPLDAPNYNRLETTLKLHRGWKLVPVSGLQIKHLCVVEVGLLHCTFDHGVCDWMSDREGDLPWETTHNPAGNTHTHIHTAHSKSHFNYSHMTDVCILL